MGFIYDYFHCRSPHTRNKRDISEANGMRLLYITANPKPVDLSFSLKLGERLLEKLSSLRKDLKIERVDVYKDDIPLIDAMVLTAWGKLEQGAPLSDD
jgi:FMN-dependent NADH-azoreductase